MEADKKLPRAIILFPVFVPAVVVTLLLVVGTISNPDLAGEVFSATLAFITTNFGWFYMLSVAFFLVFIVGIAMTPWGSIKLGPDHAEPQYSFPAWFAMLFSAGYGIALLFFGVAEPVLHYASPPAGAAQTVDSAKQAMQIAFFHWGFHIWAIYGLTGLVLAYFSFRHGLPLSMRSALYPIIGERINGPIGHVVDVFAILGTLFGIATTLGLSVTQINAGINYLWPDIPVSIGVQIIAIAIITALAICSVVAGLDKGVKNLSLLNMILAIGLMLFVFLVGPSIFILETFLQNTGSYLNNIIERTFNLQAYSRSDWIGNWTLFIFGWTIAWSPFVGLCDRTVQAVRTATHDLHRLVPGGAADHHLLRHLFGFRFPGHRFPGRRRCEPYAGLAARVLGLRRGRGGGDAVARRWSQRIADHDHRQRPAVCHHHADRRAGHVARAGDRRAPRNQPAEPHADHAPGQQCRTRSVEEAPRRAGQLPGPRTGRGFHGQHRAQGHAPGAA